MEPNAEFFRQLVDAVGEMIIVTSLDGKVTFMNRQAELAYGWTLQEAVGNHVTDLFVPVPALEDAQSIIDQVLRGETWSGEFRVLRRDGSTFPARVVDAPMYGNDGEVVGIVGISTDMTELIRERATLVRSQQVLGALGDAVGASLDLETIAQRVVDAVVPSFADIAAVHMLNNDGSFGSVAVASVSPEIAQAIRNDLDQEASGPARVMRTGVPEFYPQMPEQHVEESATSNAQAEALRSAQFRSLILVPIKTSGTVTASIGFSTFGANAREFDQNDFELATEIARRIGLALENARLYEEARYTLRALGEANSAKDEFLGLVSHELRTPITVILGNAQVLATRSVDETSRSTALRDISVEAHRLHGIVENLLMLARIETGHEEPETISAERIVRRVVARHQSEHPQRIYRLSADGGPFLAEASEFSVEQVLTNLLSNAEKYSPIDQAIDVSVENCSGEVIIAVSDRGTGIADDETASIFDPFYRSSKTTGIAGVGIGLTVCKRLVEAHRGRIWASSRDGAGTTMMFAFPQTDLVDEG